MGINVFMNSDLEGFDAILKHRFSDFNVNEIDLEGKIVKLTDLEVPKAVTKVSLTIILFSFLLNLRLHMMIHFGHSKAKIKEQQINLAGRWVNLRLGGNYTKQISS